MCETHNATVVLRIHCHRMKSEYVSYTDTLFLTSSVLVTATHGLLFVILCVLFSQATREISLSLVEFPCMCDKTIDTSHTICRLLFRFSFGSDCDAQGDISLLHEMSETPLLYILNTSVVSLSLILSVRAYCYECMKKKKYLESVCAKDLKSVAYVSSSSRKEENGFASRSLCNAA